MSDRAADKICSTLVFLFFMTVFLHACFGWP